MPSLSETTMNWECLKCDLTIWPMFWVCERSSAASTSSRMYSGAGLKSRRERMRERATSDLKDKANGKSVKLYGSNCTATVIHPPVPESKELVGSLLWVWRVFLRVLRFSSPLEGAHSVMSQSKRASYQCHHITRQCMLYLCPPLSSLRLSFHTLPNPTLTSRPSSSFWPSGGASLAVAPGRRVENIEPKSWKTQHQYSIDTIQLIGFLSHLFKHRMSYKTYDNSSLLTLLTLTQAFLKASFFFSSSSWMTAAILSLSFSTILFFFIKSLYYNKRKGNNYTRALMVMRNSPRVRYLFFCLLQHVHSPHIHVLAQLVLGFFQLGQVFTKRPSCH